MLDNVNPYALGRQARRAFDEVWSQLSNLASPTKSSSFSAFDWEPSRDNDDFESPQAASTTVLVVGATGRVGRILTRKLLLRGYTVKALVRQRSRADDQQLPAAVEVIQGDVGDAAVCQQALKGVNKVIFCAAARSTLSADLERVDDRGVMNIAKALQDEFSREARRQRAQGGGEQQASSSSGSSRSGRVYIHSEKSKKEIADFNKVYHQLRWDITFVGTADERAALEREAAAAAAQQQQQQPADLRRPEVERWQAASSAVAEINHEDHLVFEGQLYQRGAYAEVGTRLASRLPGGDHRTAGTEAITMRIRGDGNVYALVLQTKEGASYVVRFPTRLGYMTIRLPYWAFRPEREGQPPLQPDAIDRVAIRFEARRLSAAASAARAAKGLSARNSSSGTATSAQDGKFSLEVDWIKAIPGAVEPDFVLVSAAGSARASSTPAAELARIVAAKRRGEENVRLSGLGYTIIRPGLIVDEPGGYKALVFDQGDRIDQPISAADVADICLRALHEPNACNKTFDVCYELPATGTSLYELVSSAPDKSGKYLAQATSTLARNT